MRQANHAIALLAIAAGLLAGCQTNEPRSSPQPADVIHYTGETPAWIFIPFGRLTENGSGYLARIALPPRRDWTTNRMEVAVEGAVMLDGIVKLRQGSTVMQVIGCAGGFSDRGSARRVTVWRSSAPPVRLFLRSRWLPGALYREVWYDTKPDGPYPSPKDTGSNSASDYVLQPGDKISVARVMG